MKFRFSGDGFYRDLAYFQGLFVRELAASQEQISTFPGDFGVDFQGCTRPFGGCTRPFGKGFGSGFSGFFA